MKLDCHVKTYKLQYLGHLIRNRKDTIEVSVMTELEEGTKDCFEQTGF